MMDNDDFCAWCYSKGRKTLTAACTQCSAAWYCDEVCRKKHWTLHQHRCGADRDNRLMRQRNDTTTTETPYAEVATLSEANGFMERVTRAMKKTVGEGHVPLILIMGNSAPLNLFWSQFLTVGNSLVDSRGLFISPTLATPVPRGAMLTCHPAHLLVHRGELYDCTGGSSGDKVRKISPFDATNTKRDTVHVVKNYNKPISDETNLVGLPSRTDDQRLLGHMVNDACLVNVFQSTPETELRNRDTLCRILTVYYKNTLKYTNCAFITDNIRVMCALVARREIKAGEELFVSYGLTYWLELTYGADVMKRCPYIAENISKLLFDESGGNEASKKFRELLRDVTLQLDEPIMAMKSAMIQQRQ
jgi:hypothetical protein